jgi:hypothetical protein
MRRRLASLEERGAERGILGTSLQESGLDAPTWHWRRGCARATQGERDALTRLAEAGNEPEYLRLSEEVLRREAPSLADDIRCRRDGLYRELDRLEDEWRSQGRHRSTSYSDPAFWNVANAEASRRTAINRGAPLITDPEEALCLLEQITDPATTTKEVLYLVGWQG